MILNLTHLRSDFIKYRKISKVLAFRLTTLIELTKTRSKFATFHTGSDYFKVSQKYDISERTIQRWSKSYAFGGVTELNSKKKSNKEKIIIKGWAAYLILEYRTLYNWGAETIQAHLSIDHSINLSLYKINQFLKSNKLIKHSLKKKLKNKHTKLVVVNDPGVHTQIDVKHLPKILANNHKTYVYNFVDHASRWEHKEAFDSYTPMNTKIFFENVIKKAPFAILSSQTDNGVEFTSKYISHLDQPRKNIFELYLVEKNIRHRLIPPGEKELNGLVERSHRADDEEFYHRIRPANLIEFNKILYEHSQWRNENRRKKPLGWKTTFEWLCEYSMKAENTVEVKLAS